MSAGQLGDAAGQAVRGRAPTGRDFLSLGADVEVLEPPALRARLAAAARATAALYE